MIQCVSVSASCKEGGKYDLDFKNPDSTPADWKSGSACLKCPTCPTVCPMRDVTTDQQILFRRDGRLLPGDRLLPSAFAAMCISNFVYKIYKYVYYIIHVHIPTHPHLYMPRQSKKQTSYIFCRLSHGLGPFF